MCCNYPGIKLEPALGTLEDKIEHLSSYAHIVQTTAKQVISRHSAEGARARSTTAKKILISHRCEKIWLPSHDVIDRPPFHVSQT